MKSINQSPQIIHLEWGKMEIESFGKGKDFMLWPGGAEHWDWQQSNTQHSPGIQLQDIQFLVNKGCECLVLTRGMLEQLQTGQSIIDWCKKHSIQVYVEQTEAARATYNSLAKQGVRVGGLFHSTC